MFLSIPNINQYDIVNRNGEMVSLGKQTQKISPTEERVGLHKIKICDKHCARHAVNLATSLL